MSKCCVGRMGAPFLFIFTCSVFDNEEGEYAMTQYEMMLKLLDDFKQKVLEEWQAQQVVKIPDLLKNKLIMRNEKLLEENFDKEVS